MGMGPACCGNLLPEAKGKRRPTRGLKKNKRDDPLGSLAVLYFEVFTYEMC